MEILCYTPDFKYDYLVAGIIEGLKKTPGVNIYCTNPGNGAINILEKDKIVSKALECDVIFILHGKKPGDYSTLNEINVWDKCIFIDGSEWNITYYPPFDRNNFIFEDMLRKCKFYFKRECYPEYTKRGIIPLPFVALNSDFGGYSEKKEIDVLCAFGNIPGLPDVHSKSWRQVAIEACEDLKKEGYNIVNSKVRDYLRTVNRSWITMDAYGGGECNARTFQIPANRSVGFYKEFEIIIPYFQEYSDYIPWENSEDLKNKIRSFLSNKDQLEKISEDSYRNVLDYHTSEKRVQYIFEKIGL